MTPAGLDDLDGDILSEIDALTPEERDAVLKTLAKARADGSTDVLGKMLALEWEREPVDAKTWISDDYYFGEVGKSLYPKLRDDFAELVSGHYSECILSGAIGWGKTHFATIGLLRYVYELSCLRNPQASLGLSQDALIHFTVISAKKELAVKAIYEKIGQMLVLSPYFKREFRAEMTRDEIRFPKNIRIAPAATTNNAVLGLNVIGGILDESAFFGGVTEKERQNMRRYGYVDKAEVIYTLLLRRMESRYRQRGGKLPGTLFLVSSKRTVDDFIERRIREARGDANVFLREYSQWDVRPDRYGAKHFWVLVGNEQLHSRILSDKDDPAQYRDLENVQLLDVPDEFKSSFEKDLENSIREIAGVATVAVSPFIGRREKIEDAIEQGRMHPFTAFEWESGSVASFRWPLLVHKNALTGEMEPTCCPRAPRYAHIDGSLRGDATGLAVGHIHGWKDIERVEKSGEGRMIVESAPIIRFDLTLRITPPVGDEIIMSGVRVLIYELAKHGVPVTFISMDSYQSAESLQQLRNQGFRAEVVSADRSMVPYELLKAALYEDRLLLYPYPPLMDELRRLEHDRKKGKVDHPAVGSKDCADAVAGVVYSLSASREAAYANFPTEMMGPHLGISLAPGEVVPEGGGEYVPPPAEEDWEADFKYDPGGHGIGGSSIVAPPWLSAPKGRVPTHPLQKGPRQRES